MFHEYPYQNMHELNLDWILNQLNEFRTQFNEWAETISELQEAVQDLDWLDTNMNDLLVRVPAIEKSLNDLINLHDTDVKYLKSKIDDLQNQINALDINALKLYVDSRDNELMADYNKKIYDNYIVTYELFNGLKSRLEILAELVAQIDTKTFNPWPRVIRKESLQTNLNFAYSDLADSVPTAEEYAELGLSASDYNDYDLLARDYSLFGRIKLKMHYVFSPVYGFKQDINNVLTSIVNFVKGTMSADEFAALDYYSYNNQLGYVALGGAGLTSAEYSTLHGV